jgi:hypothetical protein
VNGVIPAGVAGWKFVVALPLTKLIVSADAKAVVNITAAPRADIFENIFMVPPWLPASKAAIKLKLLPMYCLGKLKCSDVRESYEARVLKTSMDKLGADNSAPGSPKTEFTE